MRKKLLFLVLQVLLLTGIAFPSVAAAQSTSDFTIDSFQADYYLSRDQDKQPHMKIIERIDATFPETDQNHGIERAIPENYKDTNVNLKVESVTGAGNEALNFSTRSSQDNRILRIGDANRYVHGQQTYIITYSLDYPIVIFPDHDELYWDTNGNGWEQTTGKVTARLHIDQSIPAESVQTELKCFTGDYGSTASNCIINQQPDGNNILVSTETSAPLGSRENLSFVVGFSSGTFASPPTDWALVILVAAIVGGVIIFPLLALIIMFNKWRKAGKDPKGKGVIIPQYQPLKSLSPLLADVIINEKMRTTAISASILELCIKKYLKLYETSVKKLIGSKTEYELELTKLPTDLSPEEKKLVSVLFSGEPTIGQRININSLKNKLYRGAGELSKLSEQTVADQGYFSTNPAKVRSKYVGWGIGMTIVGFGLFLFPFTRFTLGIGFAGIIVALFGRIMPSRTQKGVEAKEYLLGLRDYMKLAEADRIKTLQSPRGAEKLSINPNDPAQLVKLYEKLLPYAILFGIEKEWVKQFADMYAEQPDWYSGSRAFNSALFISSVSNLNGATLNSFSPPSSSGSSGFGGGGFSGGGGGGGGGGGW